MLRHSLMTPALLLAMAAASTFVFRGEAATKLLGLSRFDGEDAFPSSRVVGDPHFSSPDGVPFDFHGELDKTFCLLSDRRLHVNAVLRGYKDPRPFGAAAADADGLKRRTWMKELGVSWVDARGNPHVLHLVARSDRHSKRRGGFLKRIAIDGRNLALPYDGRRIGKGGLLFQYTGVMRLPREEQESFALTIGELLGASIVVRPASLLMRTKDNAHVHFNLNFFYINATKHVHGVLGQTYRNTKEHAEKSAKFKEIVQRLNKPIQADQESGRGFLDGNVEDYEASGPTNTDCKFSVFRKTK